MIKSKRMPVRRAMVTLLLAAAVIPVGAVSSHAATLITCTAAGSVLTTATPDTWTIVGAGSCVDSQTPYVLNFTAAGTSQGLGICGDNDLPFLITDLNLLVTGSITSTDPFAPVVKGVLQRWIAPVTTYPLGTPFLVTNGGSLAGVGVFWNHIFLNCQGSPVATFQWAYIG